MCLSSIIYLGEKTVTQNDRGGIFPDAFWDKLQLPGCRVEDPGTSKNGLYYSEDPDGTT